MASPDNQLTNPTKLTPDNPENQPATQPPEQSTFPRPEGAPNEQAENPPLPHERRLTESGRLAVDKKIEAKKAKAESKYHAKKERIEMTYAGSMEHPKALKKQQKLDGKHNAKLLKLEKKHEKEMAVKIDKIEHPEKYASYPGGAVVGFGGGAACSGGGAC
ncbi:hypothetical protein OHC33_001246 [Knufia fluminis]|uniref:Uncharacterized protein n=1 Tax=Knufia fluminis TaxID=191047 RepID=A0AAN8IC70_9EURO|nr:hypothetical protein OHC33_001246 [Knufia fluminis]